MSKSDLEAYLGNLEIDLKSIEACERGLKIPDVCRDLAFSAMSLRSAIHRLQKEIEVLEHAEAKDA
jgi:hypothetical protein